MSGPIEFKNLGIAAALKHNRLQVPTHQREYSWTDKEVEELLHDLNDAIRDRKDVHFLGTIVLTTAADGVKTVVDGQQRLATTTMLLAAIRDRIKCDKALQENERATFLRNIEGYLYTTIRRPPQIVPNLHLNVDDNEYFVSRVLETSGKGHGKNAKITKPSHRLISAAATSIERFLDTHLSNVSPLDQADTLDKWVTFLEHSAQVIMAITPDDANAFVMFETLNDRGLRTSQADLVKNYLFSQSGKRLREAQNLWSQMRGALDVLDGTDVLTFLRHSTIARYGRTREREVFAKIRNKIQGTTHSVRFLSDLAADAISYAALLSPEHREWEAYSSSIRERVKTLVSPLDVTPMRPLMLTVLRSFSKHNVEKAFRMFVCWGVRVLIGGSLRGGRFEDTVGDACQAIHDGKIATAESLADFMAKGIPSDSEFENAFAVKKVGKSSIARYYLRALEAKSADNDEPEFVPNDGAEINLEHVLPRNPGRKWGKLTDEELEDNCTRLGNQVLLARSVNAAIGNDAFDSKKRILEKSSFRLTSSVATEEKWGPIEIDRRQRVLAKLALATWPLR